MEGVDEPRGSVEPLEGADRDAVGSTRDGIVAVGAITGDDLFSLVVSDMTRLDRTRDDRFEINKMM